MSKNEISDEFKLEAVTYAYDNGWQEASKSTRSSG